VLVPLMASAGGAEYTALASLGEGIRLLAKSLAKTWGADGITAHSITLDPHAFLAARDAAGIAADNALHDPPLGRVPDDTDDIAPIIEWLASGTAAPLVGSSLVVDGGLWMPG
jgi:NAD(P)-dependent dehydrogenase (short-subunit alcohol dehydrogenase family)